MQVHDREGEGTILTVWRRLIGSRGQDTVPPLGTKRNTERDVCLVEN